MLESMQPTATQVTKGEWFDTWHAVEPLATAGSVALWRASNGAGSSALLRIYPRFQNQDTWRKFSSAAARRAKLDHPRLLPLAKLGGQGRPHLLLSDPAGEPLATRIEREPLSPTVALQVFEDVANGLEALARAGVGPVDLTAADVFIVAGDRGLVLADAGLLGQVTRGRDHAPRSPAASMSYSFAAVLRSALTGSSNGGGIPESTAAIDRFFARALADSPPRGYRTPKQLVDSFDKALFADDSGPSRRPSRRTLAGIVACALAAAAAGAAVGVATTASDPPSPTRPVVTRSLPQGGDPGARAALAKTLSKLGRRRADRRRALANANRRRGQAVAASGLATAYARAAEAASGPKAVGPSGVQAQVVAGLAAIGRSYGALAGAARGGSSAAYGSARTQILKRERELDKAIAALSPVVE